MRSLGKGIPFQAIHSLRRGLVQATSLKRPSCGNSCRFVVPEEPDQARIRLDSCISLFDEKASRQQIQNSIKNGMVSVNGVEATKPSRKISPGDVVAYELIQSTPSKVSPEAIPLDIVYSDSDIMVVNKSPGMVVHPSAGHWSGTLVNAVMHFLNLPEWDLANCSYTPSSLEDLRLGSRDKSGDSSPGSTRPLGDPAYKQKEVLDSDGLDMGAESVFRPGIVHRLDIGTSGLMVVALHDASQRHLSEQFKNRTIDRVYLSILAGCPNPGSGKISTNIGRDPTDRKAMAWFGYKSMKGRPSSSSYQTVETLGRTASLVAWKLHTGRTHQIRVHAKYMGHPVMYDETYGPSKSRAAGNPDASEWNDDLDISQLMSRPALHAASLELEHPVTHERMSFKSNLPPDFVACLSKLKQLDANP